MEISIKLSSGVEIACRSVILIPEAALADATWIRSFTTGSQVLSKHEFHALAQVALLQFDDGELTLQKTVGAINLVSDAESYCLESGLVICRLRSDALAVYINVDQSPRKYIAAAHRYCTRWVRLDI